MLASSQSLVHKVGFVWDFENCAVPRSKSLSGLIAYLRAKFARGHSEVEFVAVADVSKENPQSLEELNYAQVTVSHVYATSKNTVDTKVISHLRKFALTTSLPATVVLLSGDVIYIPILSDLRRVYGLNVVVVHSGSVSPAVLHTAHECHDMQHLLSNVPDCPVLCSLSKKLECSRREVAVEVLNFPGVTGAGAFHNPMDENKIRGRLTQLSTNLAGRVGLVDMLNSVALIYFGSYDNAAKAVKRLEGEDVFGFKLSARMADVALLDAASEEEEASEESDLVSSDPLSSERPESESSDEASQAPSSRLSSSSEGSSLGPWSRSSEEAPKFVKRYALGRGFSPSNTVSLLGSSASFSESERMSLTEQSGPSSGSSQSYLSVRQHSIGRGAGLVRRNGETMRAKVQLTQRIKSMMNIEDGSSSSSGTT